VVPPGVAGPVVENAVVWVADAAEVSEPGVVFVALASVADVSEPQAFVDIALAFDVLAPASVVAVDVYNPECPRFFSFPNSDYHASPSSSVEIAGKESVHNSIGVRANHGLCSIFSNPGLHQNKNLEHGYNKPNPGYNNVNDTNDLPRGATTNCSRKTDLHLYQEQHTHHTYQARLPQLEVPQIRPVAAEQFQYLYLPLPLLE
jgi:hypothetical protein